MDSSIRLRQLNNPEVSGYVVEILSGFISTGSFNNTNVLVLQTDLNSGVNSQFISYGQILPFTPQSVICTLANNIDQFDYDFNIYNITQTGFTVNFSDYLNNTGYILNSAVFPLGVYPFSQTSGYISSSQTGVFASLQDLENLYFQLLSYINGYSYPMNNPSGLVIGSVVYTTGNQTLYGIKTIDNSAGLKFLPNSSIQDSSGIMVIQPDANLLFQRNNINPVLNWKLLNLNDISGYVSLDWQNRLLWDNNSNLSIDYAHRILYGSWSGYNGYFSGLFISGIPVVTGSNSYFVNTGQTGLFYAASNPSGFITGLNLTPYVQTGQTGNFLTISQTGQFINSGQTGIFVDQINYQTISGYKDFEGGIGVSYISGDDNYQGMLDNNGTIAIDWINRVLNNTGEGVTIDFGNNLLMYEGQILMDWHNGFINDNNIFYNGVQSIDFFNRLLTYQTNGSQFGTAVDWKNFILSGSWSIQSGNFINSLTVSGHPVVTGNYYPLNNPSGFITTGQTGAFGQFANTGQLSGAFYPLNTNPASYITTGQTGSFGGSTNTDILTGTFYPLSGNPSSYITSGQTGAFGGSSNTGVLTGVFYPLLSNPSSYITTGQTGAFGGGSTPTGQLTGAFYPLIANPSFYVTSGQTGVFVTTNQSGSLTGAFYPLSSNPSSYITTGQTGAFGGSSNTGQLTGAFYPLIANPSFYVTSGQTGVFVTTNQSGSLTGAFYPLSSNPSSYITTGQTGAFGGSSNTGQLTGVFYPLHSNPSNYLGNLPSVSFITGINWGSGTSFYTTLTINTIITFTGSSDGMSINVLIKSTGNSNYTVSWPSGGNGVFWPAQITPIQSTGNATDIYTFVNFTGMIYGSVVQAF